MGVDMWMRWGRSWGSGWAWGAEGTGLEVGLVEMMMVTGMGMDMEGEGMGGWGRGQR